jgi:16S rRNA (uracil1498-N3)-methyltransferase
VHRFYVPGFTGRDSVELSDDEARHLARVLRLKPGATVEIFDGQGQMAAACVEDVAPRRTTVRITGPGSAAREAAVKLTLAQALLKSDKMDRVIRDAVMLGAAAIQPFVSKRTEVPRMALRSGIRLERWDRTVVASVKQCGRAVVPPVLAPLGFGELLSRDTKQPRLMLVEPGGVAPGALADLRSLEESRPSGVLVLIGPEGGWDPSEIEQAAAAGVTLVSLGSRTLRADAAGAAAIVVLQYLWRDL